jgi:WD40 repeat protein
VQWAAKDSNSAQVRIGERRLRQDLLSRPRAILRGHSHPVEGIAFSPPGKLLACSSKDGMIGCWAIASMTKVA